MNASKIVKVGTTEIPYTGPGDDKPVKKVAAKKAAAKKVAVEKLPNNDSKAVDQKPSPTKVEAKSKRELAQVIFDKNFNRVPRKDILILFMSEAGLTKAGSSTYYSNFKKKFEETES